MIEISTYWEGQIHHNIPYHEVGDVAEDPTFRFYLQLPAKKSLLAVVRAPSRESALSLIMEYCPSVGIDDFPQIYNLTPEQWAIASKDRDQGIHAVLALIFSMGASLPDGYYLQGVNDDCSSGAGVARRLDWKVQEEPHRIREVKLVDGNPGGSMFSQISAGMMSSILAEHDQPYKIGDYLTLREYREFIKMYSGRYIKAFISHIAYRPNFPDSLQKNQALLSLSIQGTYDNRQTHNLG